MTNNSKATFPMFFLAQSYLTQDESFESLCCIDWDTGESTGNCIIDVTNVCADSCDPTICGTPHSNPIDIASLINDITILSALTSLLIMGQAINNINAIGELTNTQISNAPAGTALNTIANVNPVDYQDLWNNLFPVASRKGDIHQKDYNYDNIIMNSDGNVTMDIATLQNLLNTYGIEIH